MAGLRWLGSVLLFLGGILVYTQTHLGIYETADPDFLAWLRVTGIVLIFHGILLSVALFLHLEGRKEGIGLSVVFSAIYFIQLAALFRSPEIVPVMAYSDAQAYLLEDSDLKDTLVQFALGAVLLFILLSVVGHMKALWFLGRKPSRWRA